MQFRPLRSHIQYITCFPTITTQQVLRNSYTGRTLRRIAYEIDAERNDGDSFKPGGSGYRGSRITEGPGTESGQVPMGLCLDHWRFPPRGSVGFLCLSLVGPGGFCRHLGADPKHRDRPFLSSFADTSL